MTGAIAAVVLAAGSSKRAGALNKLLAPINGVPMIARTVDHVLASRARPVVVVTGFEADKIHDALAGRAVSFVHNHAFADGMGTSIAAGIGALDGACAGVLICLGDMPGLGAAAIDSLMDAFDPDAGRGICVPRAEGRRGNPVLFGRAYFDELMGLEGDQGAKGIVSAHEDAVSEVPMTDDGTLLDLDTEAAIAAFIENTPDLS